MPDTAGLRRKLANILSQTPGRAMAIDPDTSQLLQFNDQAEVWLKTAFVDMPWNLELVGDTAMALPDGTKAPVEIIHPADPEAGYLLVVPTGEDSEPASFDQIRDDEALFRTTFESANVGIAHIGADGSWLRVNDAICASLGYTRAEFLEMTFQDITHPDDLEADLDLLDELVAGNIRTYSMDKRYIDKSGHVVWANLTVAAQRRPDGGISHFISIIIDISERKAAEQMREHLARELAHRSKNLLTVIQSVAELMVPTVNSVEEFSERLADRMQAIARSNDLMLAHSVSAAALREVVSLHMAPFAMEQSGRIVMEGQDIRVSNHAVQGIGLALFELATNALKHGALSNETGKIQIVWGQNTTDEADWFISWTERDGPAVSAPEHQGFGSDVLTAIAPAFFGATAELSFDQAGVQWQMTVPRTHVRS
ncbi:MAG: PAS domain S-box protein [Pseudomonadota bacterium]